ncbi:MAG: S1 RNA-binding domain-containing protein, partial [Candidatus Omnitrophota bacterium]
MTNENEQPQQDDLTSLYEGTMKTYREGDILKGIIVEIRSKEVIVDVGFKSEGTVPLYEFEDPKAVKIGDEVEVFIEATEDEDGMLRLSKDRAKRTQGWDAILMNFKEGDNIQGKIIRKIKG